MAETGTSYLLAIRRIVSNSGSSCSIGMLENRRPDGGGLDAEYFPVRRPWPSGESGGIGVRDQACDLMGGPRLNAYRPTARYLAPSWRRIARYLRATSARDCIRLDSRQVGHRVSEECRTFGCYMGKHRDAPLAGRVSHRYHLAYSSSLLKLLQSDHTGVTSVSPGITGYILLT